MCGHPSTSVIDSGPSDDLTKVRRRRACRSKKCQKRFTTYEVQHGSIVPHTFDLEELIAEDEIIDKFLQLVKSYKHRQKIMIQSIKKGE